jgi:hypothetical protein
MVFTVNGAASARTYRTSDASGSLVPVLAHSRRCGRAPAVEDARPARGAKQAAVHLVRPLRDRNAELIAQRLRHSTRDGRVPKEGLPAIEEAIFAGIPINVTLLFSHEHYLAAADAFLRGIERRVAAGLQREVGSVASAFISRWCRGS